MSTHPNSLKNLIKIKPGQVLNPNGRPKSTDSKCLTSTLKNFLDKEIKREYDGKKTSKHGIIEHLVNVLVNKALSGDQRAIELIFDRVEGKIKSQEEDKMDDLSGKFKSLIDKLPD